MRWLRILVHVGALVPLVLLAWDFSQGQLTANPIREVQLRTGRYALTILLLSLACTPVYIISGFKQVLSFRRTLGLYAFSYASLHFLNFIGVDYGFDLAFLKEDIFNKRYALVGFAAYLVLIPLVITSTRGWVMRLGENWRRLHRLVYLSATLAVIHLLWSAKADFRLPLIYTVVLVLLLLFRIPWIRKLFNNRNLSF